MAHRKRRLPRARPKTAMTILSMNIRRPRLTHSGNGGLRSTSTRGRLHRSFIARSCELQKRFRRAGRRAEKYFCLSRAQISPETALISLVADSWLAGIAHEITSDRARKRLCKISQFLLTNAGNSTELRGRRRINSRHFAQRNIGEDDVGGHVAFVGDSAAQNAQLCKQRFVAFEVTGTMLFGSLGRVNVKRLCQCDRFSFAQGRPSGLG